MSNLIEITYEATFEGGDSEHFALEVTPRQLANRTELRQLCLNDLESRWMPEYTDWPKGEVVRVEIEPPGGDWVEI